MFDVVLDITDLSVPDLLVRAGHIKNGIAAQPVYASLAPKLTSLDGKIATLTQKQTALAAAKAAVGIASDAQDAAEAELAAALNALGSDIGKLATTVAEVEAAQLRVKDSPKPRPVPSKPNALELTAGDEEGELSGQCEGQPGVVDYYEIEYATADPNAPGTSWHHADTSKKSRFDLNGLPTGQKVWVRLRAVNARGKSSWSDPVSKRVP
ncbi:MAG: fibronectin type III domain-containing protein [Roseimicrobium sp.]